MTVLVDPVAEAARRLRTPPVARPVFATPGELARAIDPHVVQTPALDLIDQALVDVAEGRCNRLMINMPPQEGKSWRVTTATPLWMLGRNPDLRIAILSYGQDLADEFGRNIRDAITNNAGDEGTLDLGLRIARDNGAVRRWRIAGHRGGVRSVGISGGLTGRPADIIIIDDPFKSDLDAESETWRERVWKVWQGVVNTRLAPNAPVILVMTRWHHDDLAGRLLKAPDAHRWRVINIPAQADHNPAKGETDPLGRDVGEFLVSSRGRTPQEWEAIRVAVGSRVWGSLYQGHPTPSEGGVFKRQWWRFYDHARAVQRSDGTWHAIGADEVVISVDCAFEDASTSDWVVLQVWARRGTRMWLLHQVRDRLDLPATAAALEQLAAAWPQARRKLVEKKANGHGVIQVLRGKVGGLIPIVPTESKVSRANGVSAFVEGGDVELPHPSLAPWIGTFVDEAAEFPHGSHDDQVDGMTQALNKLLVQGSPADDFMSGLLADRDDDY
jgi:predicted phage terminase large subunit-like protein